MKKKNVSEKQENINNGQMDTIIDYNDSSELTVQFEDGTIKKHVSYDNFCGERVSPKQRKKDGLNDDCYQGSVNQKKKKERMGETRMMSCGMMATIINYESSADIDVRFEDDAIKEHVKYKDFCRGLVRNPNIGRPKKTEHIGESKMMNCGMMATIINYEGSSDMDVRFEDGFIKNHVTYPNFSRGLIRNPNIDRLKKTERIGESRMMNCGMMATIINYESSADIDVRFEDGFIKNHVTYWNFSKGLIRYSNKKRKTLRKTKLTECHKEERIGETRKMKNGKMATIIDYKNARDVTVQFDSGEIREHILYTCFCRGAVACVSRNRYHHVGESRIMKNGEKATIIEYFTYYNITVMFEDGTVRKCMRCDNFIKGNISKCSRERNQKTRIGETRIMKNGQKATIVSYNNAHDMTVLYEDGMILEHVRYDGFTRGYVPLTMKGPRTKIDSYLGMSKYMNNGERATIVKYENYHNIWVCFEDGSFVGPRTMTCFNRGQIAKPKKKKDKQE